MFFAMAYPTSRNRGEASTAFNLKVGGYRKHEHALRALVKSNRDGFVQDETRTILTARLKGETLFKYEGS